MFSKTMEYCNKGMVRVDPLPPSYEQRSYFLHFLLNPSLILWKEIFKTETHEFISRKSSTQFSLSTVTSNDPDLTRNLVSRKLSTQFSISTVTSNDSDLTRYPRYLS